MPKVKKELPPPTVTHIMADGSVRTSLKGYLKSFDQLPETAQRLISHIDNINMYYLIILFLFRQYSNYTKNSPPALIGKRAFSISLCSAFSRGAPASRI